MLLVKFENEKEERCFNLKLLTQQELKASVMVMTMRTPTTT